MRPGASLGIIACAAVLCSAVVWFADARPSLVAPVGLPRPTDERARKIDELFLRDAEEIRPQRSHLAATPAADVTAERAAEVPPATLASGSVHGRVLDQDDAAVASVAVSLHRGRTRTETETDSGGRFAFEGLASGVYRLYVDGRSLPDGFLPPWRQQIPREATASPTGIFGTALRLTDGAEREVDLRVFAACSVSGRLVGPFGEPIERASVSIASSAGVVHSARTDAAGGFAMANVYPGSYTTIVKLGESAGSASSSPLPIQFDVAAGEFCVLPDLVSDVGGHVLRGAIVDAAGLPVSGLEVRCEEAAEAGPTSHWLTVTDDSGRFELGRVPSARLVVTVGPDECSKPEGIALLSAQTEPFEVDARGAPDELDIGSVQVEASHPFRLTVRVRIDPAWAEANPFAQLSVRVDGKEVGEPRSRNLTPTLSAARPSRHSTDEFTWGCATPHVPVELTVELRSSRGVEHERSETVHPAADTTREVLVAFP